MSQFTGIAPCSYWDTDRGRAVPRVHFHFEEKHTGTEPEPQHPQNPAGPSLRPIMEPGSSLCVMGRGGVLRCVAETTGCHALNRRAARRRIDAQRCGCPRIVDAGVSAQKRCPIMEASGLKGFKGAAARACWSCSPSVSLHPHPPLPSSYPSPRLRTRRM